MSELHYIVKFQMITTIYQLYIAYLAINAIHGTYVAYVYLRWMLGSMYGASLWLYSWIYDIEEPLLQIEDKKKDKETSFYEDTSKK